MTTALVIALVCLVTLGTTGRTAATEHQVLTTVDLLGTRLVTLTDSTGTAGIDSSVVDLLTGMESVEWAFALGPAVDATMPGLGTTVAGAPVTARPIVGQLPAEMTTGSGRTARGGEAVAGTRAATNLGLTAGVGTAHIRGNSVAVVGTFSAEGPLSPLDGTLVLRPDRTDAFTVRYVYLRVAPAYDVQAVADLVEAVTPASTPSGVDVDVARGALELRTVLSGTLGESARQLMAMVLGVGMVLVSVTVTGAVNARRRDFGRQRAIGASRSAIVTLVVVQSAISGLLGAAAGSAGGILLAVLTSAPTPTPTFILSVITLSLIVALLGAAPPAVIAARRDPVLILRVP
ncbi:ABC transporter permease [Cellulomonas hominis]